jgi:ribosomal protein S18 acetylase RimI-like enzyme
MQSPQSEVSVRIADLFDETDAHSVIELLDHYAEHPFGLGHRLPDDVRNALLPGLRGTPNTLAFLARAGEVDVGLALCFVGFSSFRAKPLLNIHDLVVHQSIRGQGAGRTLLNAVIHESIRRGFCAVTLEVRRDNAIARRLYSDLGFADLHEPLPEGCQLFGKLDLSKRLGS